MLAALALVVFSLAPLVHGLIHADHAVETLAAAHGPSPGGLPAKGKTDDGSTCPFQIFGAHAHTVLAQGAVFAVLLWLSLALLIANHDTPTVIALGAFRNRGPPA
jgi:hypothetical protein